MLNKEFSNKVFSLLQITPHFFYWHCKKRLMTMKGTFVHLNITVAKLENRYITLVENCIFENLYCCKADLSWDPVVHSQSSLYNTLLYHISFGTLRSLGKYTAYICKRYTRVSTLNTDLVMFKIIHWSFLRGCCQNQITNLYAEVAVLHTSDFDGF